MTHRVLVTGGAGFVGSTLVRSLVERGYSVVVIDNFSRGRSEFLPKHDSIDVVQGNICSRTDVEQALSGGVQSVIHLAALHYIPYCNEHPDETIHVNVFGTQVILDVLADSEGLEKLIFASTAAVYGPSDAKHEESEPMSPIDIYGISKMLGEHQVNLFRAQTGVAAINARLFNVVGPRETNPHLVPDILDQLPTTNALKLGNLVPKRDYIYTEDVANALVTLLENDCRYDSVNIGAGQAYSAADLVEIIGDIMASALKIDSIPERQRAGDRPNLCSDNSKLKEFGWRCNNDIRASIRKTLEAYGKI